MPVGIHLCWLPTYASTDVKVLYFISAIVLITSKAGLHVVFTGWSGIESPMLLQHAISVAVAELELKCETQTRTLKPLGPSKCME